MVRDRSAGPDTAAVSAPAGILDADPESREVDGVDHQNLTGVWEARTDTLDKVPDYDREKPFKRWLVSSAGPASS